MSRMGLYLSGAGSLDGSDIFTAVMAYYELQERNIIPVPIGRDISQGKVLDHRTARPLESDRNCMAEAARIVRGKITDMREVSVESLDGAIIVGGGGTLSTWTDFDDRKEDCRITERLKYQILDFYKQNKPLYCLDNAVFVVALSLRDRVDSIRLNMGSNKLLTETVEEWGMKSVDDSPSWDDRHLIGSYPDMMKKENLFTLKSAVSTLLDQPEE